MGKKGKKKNTDDQSQGQQQNVGQSTSQPAKPVPVASSTGNSPSPSAPAKSESEKQSKPQFPESGQRGQTQQKTFEKSGAQTQTQGQQKGEKKWGPPSDQKSQPPPFVQSDSVRTQSDTQMPVQQKQNQPRPEQTQQNIVASQEFEAQSSQAEKSGRQKKRGGKHGKKSQQNIENVTTQSETSQPETLTQQTQQRTVQNQNRPQQVPQYPYPGQVPQHQPMPYQQRGQSPQYRGKPPQYQGQMPQHQGQPPHYQAQPPHYQGQPPQAQQNISASSQPTSQFPQMHQQKQSGPKPDQKSNVQSQPPQVQPVVETVAQQIVQTTPSSAGPSNPQGKGSRVVASESQVQPARLQTSGSPAQSGYSHTSPPRSGLMVPKRKPQTVPKRGKKINIETNHFALTIKLKQQKAIHYDVMIDPDKPKKLFVKVLDKYIKTYFPTYEIAFDGMKNAYSPVSLPLENRSHTGLVEIMEEGRNKPTKFTVKLQFAAEIDLTTLMDYMKHGSSHEVPQNALQCLDIVLRNSSLHKLLKIGRCFYTRPERPYNLGGGLDLWYGHFQSVILGWKPFINLDVAHKGFTKEQNVIHLVEELENPYNREKCLQVREIDRETMMNLKKYLRNLKVYFEIPKQSASKRLVTVKDIVGSPVDIKFNTDDGKTMTVFEYFTKEKKYTIQYPKFPCIATGKDKKVCYPIELCRVVGGQNVLLKMDPNQTKNLIKVAATKPPVRQDKIRHIHKTLGLDNDPTAKAFGLSVSDKFARVEARILDPPSLQYNNQIITPRNGVWNAATFYSTTKLNKWEILNLERTNPNSIMNFINELNNAARRLGIEMSSKPATNATIRLNQLMECLRKAANDKTQIVFVIIGGKSTDYSQVKQIAELKVGVLTQCIKKNTVERMNASTASMILQKVNSKLDATNHCLAINSKPKCLSIPCMIVGADVTHPAPTQDDIPSFVGVTASHDVHAYKYNTVLKIQPPKTEIISDFEEIMKRHLIYFYKKTNRKPERIIIFRDGVSEGQFQQVMQSELSAIRAACKSLQSEYQPKISMFIVQKRHHTRFFPIDNNCDRNSNPLPGTIVDTEITHPTELDFYLLSHASIQGTSRPTRYHCVWDDADMSEDEIQHLTYYLCHLYTRCTRTVSYPTPTYYAHLAAARAKALCEGVNIDLRDVRKFQDKLNICEKILNENPMFYV